MKHLLVLAGLSLASAANAQAISCRIPDQLPPAAPEPAGPRRLLPVGGYTLALSWSPEYCRTRRQEADDQLQCAGPGDRFGFVLHGLWPDGGGEAWPQYCRPAGTVPAPVVRETICATPSVALQQHEWSKHGACAFPSAEAYFRASRGLYAAIRYPDMDALSRNRGLHVAGLAAAFAARNPRLSAAMLRVELNKRGWLEQVMICLDRRFRPRACPADAADRDRRPVRIWRAAR